MTTDQFIDRVTGKPATAYTPPEDRVPAPAAAPEPSSVLPAVQPGDRAGEAQDGRTAAEWISDLVKARQAAEAEVERLGSVVRDYGQQAITKANEHAAVAAERDALAVKLARLEALRDEQPGHDQYISFAEIDRALADAASPSGLDDDAPTSVVASECCASGSCEVCRPGSGWIA